MDVLDSLVIGAGQAGLSASYHLTRTGVRHVVLDANAAPGGAWQHRWDELTMHDVHGIAELPGDERPAGHEDEPANRVVPEYFAAYESSHRLPIVRPVLIDRVEDVDGALVSTSRDGRVWRSRTLVNATGTWTRPFLPYYPGRETFAGDQLHTADYPGAGHFRGRRVVVVGGGASAVQLLGAIAPVAARAVWVTRRPPVWRTGPFTPEVGLAIVGEVEERVRQGLPPTSVVGVTGLQLREQERAAEELGVYRDRRPMFSRIEPDRVVWDDGSAEEVDVILWATGFRYAVEHLAPLRLRSPAGGIALTGRPGSGSTVTSVADPRVQLVGYGPSASTIGANRAGRAAARTVREQLGVVASA
ncbi:NAD(P)-binding domain-containing protein [Nocardioides fonticola]|uniref:NAD(P)-binding domain-containing protein n=1 Tax=Nocardioides fonticola TaxID=450363 RepID=A0ABP7X9T3_9ACTN